MEALPDVTFNTVLFSDYKQEEGKKGLPEKLTGFNYPEIVGKFNEIIDFLKAKER